MIHRSHVVRPEYRHFNSEFGWHTHSALESWLARADIKASVLLALQGVAAILVVTSRDVVLESSRRWPGWVGAAGLCVLSLAICVTAGAIVPILGSSRLHMAQSPGNMIYFGHLRFWRADAAATTLVRLSPSAQTRMLANQLVFLARINWRKHRLLQISAVLTIAVMILLTVAAIGAHVDIDGFAQAPGVR